MHPGILAEMQKDGYSGSKKAATRGGEWQGPCILPRCAGSGKDRLRVQPSYGPYGYFECRVCNSKGSLVDYLMLKRGYSKQQALAEVGWKPKDGSEPQFIIPKSILTGKEQPTHEAPPIEWQESAKAFVRHCEDILWSEQGQPALDYLRARGLKDETIKMARLGYNPAEMKRPGQKWGSKKAVTLYQGIVIPWFIGDDIWRLTIRDETVAEGNERYRQVSGGSNGLYLGFSLGLDRPVILVEGEIDALSIAQEAGHHISVVATGSTEGGHTARWVVELARKDLVLVAFDAEEKGDEAAQWWTDRLENAHRLRPWWCDANQMLQDGIDLLNDWILPAIDAILAEQIYAEPVPTSQVADKIPDDCTLCGKCLDQDKETVAVYSYGEDMYCGEHYPPLQGLNSFISSVQEAIPALRSATVEYWPIENSERMMESILRKRQAEIADQPKTPYEPTSLPLLPRQACPCYTIDWTDAGSYKKQVKLPCHNEPADNGFCSEHQASYDILQIGAKLGYPELQIPFTWKHKTLQRTVHAGLQCWEEHVCTHLSDRPRARQEELTYATSRGDLLTRPRGCREHNGVR